MFASGHLQGAIHVGLDGRFAEYAGDVVRPDQPVVVVTDEGRETEAKVRLARIGVDGVQGAVVAEARPARIPMGVCWRNMEIPEDVIDDLRRRLPARRRREDVPQARLSGPFSVPPRRAPAGGWWGHVWLEGTVEGPPS
jgi:hypothetical protein